LFCCDFGKIIPKEITTKIKSINLHFSLLPKLKGSTPVITALLKNYKKTGITFIQMTEKVDEGPILYQKKIKINE
jgi:methionyl-tRNA formyltransferase